ncbi:unnamed protein product [Prunus armeniaca]
MDVGHEVFLPYVEGDAKWMNIFFLPIVEDTLGEGTRVWLGPNGMMVALLLILEMWWISFIFSESVGMVRLPVLRVIRFLIFRITNLLGKVTGGLWQRAKVIDSWVVKIYKNRGGFLPELRDLILVVLVNLGWGMRSVPRPTLCWSAMKENGQLARQGALDTLGDVMLRELVQRQHEVAPLLPRDACQSKVSFWRTPHEGCAAECQG